MSLSFLNGTSLPFGDCPKICTRRSWSFARQRCVSTSARCGWSVEYCRNRPWLQPSSFADSKLWSKCCVYFETIVSEVLAANIRVLGGLPLSSSSLNLLLPLSSKGTVSREPESAYFLGRRVGTAGSHASVDHDLLSLFLFLDDTMLYVRASYVRVFFWWRHV